MEAEKKKKGRQTKIQPNIKIEVVEVVDDPKKKGRKPKGGKLIAKPVENAVPEVPLANIILHLKCSFKDLIEYNSKQNSLASISYNPDVPNIMTYNAIENDNFCAYGESKSVNNNAYDSETYVCKVCNTKETDDDAVNIKDINAKL